MSVQLPAWHPTTTSQSLVHSFVSFGDCFSPRFLPLLALGGGKAFDATVWDVGSEMTGRGHPLLVYVDPDPKLRRLANATFRSEYIVESVATVEDMRSVIEPAVAIINLSDTTDLQPVWDRLTGRWPSVPAVVVLTTEAAIRRDREALWALGPASIVVNPYSPDAMRRGVVAALS